MEKIMARQIVTESGKDHTGRTMIAVYGCYFPDPAHANYDILLKYDVSLQPACTAHDISDCLDRLAPYAETDYVIIFFAEPMEHAPQLSWMYKAYKSLERKYKKNIKKLFVTHPSMWFKFIIWIMSKILSDKFAKKIEPIDSLEELDKMIPLDKVFVPPAVTGHDRGMPPVAEGENETILPSVRIFGAEVERAAPSGEIPNQILKVVKQLEETGLQEEGIFRLSPDTVQVEQIRMSMDRDYDIDLSEFSPHALAAALKAYFRQIPTPLIPPSTYEDLGGVFEYHEDSDRSRFIRRHVLDEMSSQRRSMLSLVIRLLRKTAANYEQNKMHPRNLAAIWTPNLIRCESIQEEMRMLATSQKFIEVLIELSDNLFGRDEDESGNEDE